MISTSTTLVLGAGSSIHLNYPLGRDLVNRLCGLIGTGHDYLPDLWSSGEVDDFLTALKEYDPSSIDEFLEARQEDFPDLGRCLIARELKVHEDRERFFPPADPGWYRELFDALLHDDGSPSFEESKLNIITYNYDRSLEVYLHERLKGRFQLNDNEAGELVAAIPLVHVHGSMGEYPGIPYQAQHDPDELLKIAGSIKIIHEIGDPDDGFCSDEFEEAHGLLTESQRIFFLGFGWHRYNLRRLRFFSPETTQEREIVGTVAGIAPLAKAKLAKRLDLIGIRHSGLHSNRCEDLFANVVSLTD